ncbi:MAG: hypothetical protein OXS29_10375 [bacterium]|nr:hypothetical protein [bacterium]MDE0287097.1 hypothetical protein [bacterium]MDE0440135.1 hypothetical protein [bacterium]
MPKAAIDTRRPGTRCMRAAMFKLTLAVSWIEGAAAVTVDDL